MPRTKKTMTPVRVAMDSAQSSIEGTSSMRLLTMGRVVRYDDGFTLMYSESGVHEEMGMFMAMTRFTCKGERVLLERVVPEPTTILFDKQRQFTFNFDECEGLYRYRIVSDDIDYHVDDQAGHINISYSVIGAYEAGKFSINIKFAPQKKPRSKSHDAISIIPSI